MPSITLLFAILFAPPLLLWSTGASGSEDREAQEETLSAFEEPLRSELLSKGYSPKNAAITSHHLLDEFVRWV